MTLAGTTARLEVERRFAIEAVVAASLLTSAVRRRFEPGQAVAKADASPVTVADLGAAGEYTLAFQLISADGHTLSETLRFTYEPAAGTPAAVGSTTMPTCGAPAEAPAGGGEAAAPGAAQAEADAIVLTVAIVGALIAAAIVVLVAVSGRPARTATATGDVADDE